MLALLCVLAFTFGLSWKLGMDLRLPDGKNWSVDIQS